LDDSWRSLADQNLTGWDEAPASDASLSELNPFNELELSPGDRYNLGQIFNATQGTPDLELGFLLANAADFQIGAVLYQLASDFNLDQTVDDVDLALWQSAYGVDDSADADGDGDTDGRDFLIWQRQSGPSTAPFAAAKAVPETGTSLLRFIGATLYLCSRKNITLTARFTQC
jgi:hypothetical protein